jgi:hypothetical protein
VKNRVSFLTPTARMINGKRFPLRQIKMMINTFNTDLTGKTAVITGICHDNAESYLFH